MKKQTIITATNTVGRISICVVTLLLANSVSAQTTTHTLMMTFNNELAMDAITTTLDFESLTAGDNIANAQAIDGFTFGYDFGGVSLQVGENQTTSSPAKYLGTDDADLLQDGDDFTITFNPANAFGIKIVSADDLIDGDISLTFNSTTVDLVGLDVQQTLSDGSLVYFLGITSDQTDTTASISTIGGGFFLYNVDDIVRAEMTPILLGDVNGDGFVNLLDVEPFIAVLSSAMYQAEADTNEDGFVNLLDVDPFIAILSGP